MLSECRIRELHQSLVDGIDKIMTERSAQGFDEEDIRKLHPEIARWEAQIEILNVVIDHNNQQETS